MKSLIFICFSALIIISCETANDNVTEAAQYFSQFSKADRSNLPAVVEQNRALLVKTGFNKFIFERDKHSLDEINKFYDSLGASSTSPYFKVKIISHAIMDYGLAKRTDSKSKERLGEYLEVLSKSPWRYPDVFIVGLTEITSHWDHDRIAKVAEFEIYKTKMDLREIEAMLSDEKSTLKPENREELIKIQSRFNEQIVEIKKIANL